MRHRAGYDTNLLRRSAVGQGTWRFRGDDDYEIISAGSVSPSTLAREARIILMWIALYVALGAMPVVAALLRALLILVTIPFLANRLAEWRAALTVRAAGTTMKNPDVPDMQEVPAAERDEQSSVM